MWLIKFLLALAGFYALVVALAYVLQTWLIFPAGLASMGPSLPEGARDFELESGQRAKVVVVHLPPRQQSAEPRPLLLGFGGNAWNPDALALMLRNVFPEHQVAVMHYRGYGRSGGRPSASAIFEDARRAYDRLAREADTTIVGVGLSLGASVAVDLAAARPLKGLVLVTPFDSLRNLAAVHYPWLPVRLLLRHRMETADTLRDLDVPVAIVTADEDNIVPEQRSTPVVTAARDLRSAVTVRGAGHNDIYDLPEFAEALRASVAAVARD